MISTSSLLLLAFGCSLLALAALRNRSPKGASTPVWNLVAAVAGLVAIKAASVWGGQEWFLALAIGGLAAILAISRALAPGFKKKRLDLGAVLLSVLVLALVLSILL